jgi:hypothetical protein
MKKSKTKIGFSSIILLTVSFLILLSCQEQKKKNSPSIAKNQGIIEYDIRNCEKLIPNSVYDSNHVVIWRDGSIYFSEYTSCLIIEKKQLKDDQILCYYLTFVPDKPSNYRNWKFTTIYELTLENKPFHFPLKNKTVFTEIDSLCFECQCEGIEANVYFMKDFNSDAVYPVHRKYNKNLLRNIEYLFKQISKKEHVQTLALIGDSVDYKIAHRIMKSDSINYCIKDDSEVGSLQRLWGDK